MSKWFFINGAVLIYAIIKISMTYSGIHMLFGGIGLCLILYNWTRHAVFSTIRSNISRQRKIAYANLSKKALPIHKWTGTSALILILLHAFFVIKRYGIQLTYLKMTVGLAAGLTLLITVLFGWLRWQRTTVARRYIHWTLAFILFFATLLHLLL